ncbi:hypothetical protein GCM10022416_23270 [Actinomadura keratinilytica]|jgi:hypothetical protein|uniref:Uncharacterized protein n=1 Tax=Actinomadura keratinilytica TaxID=547461 RepID=A0ABP7YMZ0_9ACTN
MEQAQYNVAWPPVGTAPQGTVRWGEVGAARPAGIPPGAPAVPLRHTPARTNRRSVAEPPDDQTRQTISAHVEGCFPGVQCWWGLYTRRWWAYVPTTQGDHLLEAVTPDALFWQVVELVRRARTSSWAANR